MATASAFAAAALLTPLSSLAYASIAARPAGLSGRERLDRPRPPESNASMAKHMSLAIPAWSPQAPPTIGAEAGHCA
jgi:hypothetical protein